MAKTKPGKGSRTRNKSGLKAHKNSATKPKETPETLLAKATTLLQTSQPDAALPLAQRALAELQPSSTPTIAALPALNLLGEINVELGDIDAARGYFADAASIDPEGLVPEDAGGGTEKFFWLAQLSEEGGADSVEWFERGIAALRRDIATLERRDAREDTVALLEEKRKKLANALCAVAEIYMTDLSWEEDAEARCEALVTEACLVAPNNPEAFQTLASVRISQLKLDDARAALSRSMSIWKDLPPEDPTIPDFPTRISLARLLMEAEMEDDALEVLERLVLEDDSSVEAWYLGGWCLHLMGEKKQKDQSLKANSLDGQENGDVNALFKSSRDWLNSSLRLYSVLDYEDDRLREHATELVAALDSILGPAEEAEAEEDGWEDEADEEDDEDHDMEDS